MRLVASMLTHNERSRYLEACVDHLFSFCDVVCIHDDGSTDGTLEYLLDLAKPGSKLKVQATDGNNFFEDESKVRNLLLDFTFAQEPTHVLAIDADEFVADGFGLRQELRATTPDVTALHMEEVWEIDGDCLCIREDGGWLSHPVPIVYHVPADASIDPAWRIAERKLACGREPVAVRKMYHPARTRVATSILHFGWTNEATRQARYERYVESDGGRYHRNTHIESIMDAEVKLLRGRTWPPALDLYKHQIRKGAGV